jgi:hypothetical protein
MNSLAFDARQDGASTGNIYSTLPFCVRRISVLDIVKLATSVDFSVRSIGPAGS